MNTLIKRHTRNPIKFNHIPPEIRYQQTECVICCEEFHPRSIIRCSLYCGHIFHRRCLDVWYREVESIECPLCRSHPPMMLKALVYHNPVLLEEDHATHFFVVLKNFCMIVGFGYIAIFIYKLYII